MINKRTLIPLLVATMISLGMLGGSVVQADSTTRTQMDLAQFPLSFIPNAGQTDPIVRFQARLADHTIFFTSEAIVFNPAASQEESAPVWLNLVGANRESAIEGREKLSGVANFLQGNNPVQWYTNVPTYRAISYRDLYPGIDLAVWGTEKTLESEFQVAPGANPKLIRFKASGVETNADTLVLPGLDSIIATVPVAYQKINGRRVAVEGRYHLVGDGQVDFRLGSYDSRYPLMIRLTFTLAAGAGSSSTDYGHSIAVDAVGNAYVTGTTASTNFPIVSPVQNTNAGGPGDVFVTKLNSDGSQALYSTYLGGSWFDEGLGIAVDSAGSAYVVGTTTSPDFPTTNPFQLDIGGSADAFVAKLNPTGNVLLYATYLGGKGIDSGHDIVVDDAGQAYVIGQTDSGNFPTKDAFQPVIGGSVDAFVVKLTMLGDELVYATYLGGAGNDPGNGIAVDSTGAVHVTGTTTSSDFPTVNSAQPIYGGSFDAFVAELNAFGDTLNYATYLGGSGTDFGNDIAVDSTGQTYVTGIASRNFPTKNSSQSYGGGTRDTFVARLNGAELVWATSLGGSGHDRGLGIAVDSEDAVYVTGATTSTNLPSGISFQPAYGGAFDAFVMKLNPGDNALVYTTYLGGNSFDSGNGIAVDDNGFVYVVGETISTNYPTRNPLQPAYGGGARDAFVTKLNTTGSSLIYSTYLGGRIRANVQHANLDHEESVSTIGLQTF